MQGKPDKWVDPKVYQEQRIRSFRLYMGVHWDIKGNEPRKSNTRQEPKRKLRPEFQKWLDDHQFPHRLVLKGNGRSKITFEDRSHAMLWKLTWT